MTTRTTDSGYAWSGSKLPHSAQYLLPTVLEFLANERKRLELQGLPLNLFDLGCGNASITNKFHEHGWRVIGVDPSAQGVAWAKQAYPMLAIHQGSAYDDLERLYGRHRVVTSLEVVSHVYYPRRLAKTVYNLLEPGGLAIISTPYHGYIKNLALALSGKMDDHFHALWDHGFIKFFSMKTMTSLLIEAGFIDLEFIRVGRVPPLAKAMIVVARKPHAS